MLRLSPEQLQLPTVGNSFLDKATEQFQYWTNFMTGPVAMMLCVLFTGIAWAMWNLSPREGFLGTALRVVGFCIGLLNIVPLIKLFIL